MNPPIRKSPSHTIRDHRRESTNKTSMILGDGDSARCCRLCGADYNLKFFKDTYIWEGVEEKYDQLLYDCFGVTVSPDDSMICEWCIRALRNTERFRALVHAAFDVTASNSDVTSKDTSSSVITLIAHSCHTTNSRQNLPSKTQPQIEKKLGEKTKLQGERKRMCSESKSVKKSKWMRPEFNYKRINVQCNICNQKYPMVVSNGDLKSFTCSRCKKYGGLQSTVCNKCNIVLARNMIKEHMELHVKANLRGKTRLRYLKKKLSPSPTVILVKQTYPCMKCPMKYNNASQLTSHVRNAHGDIKYLNSECKKTSVASYERTTVPLVPKEPQRDEFQLLFHNKRAVHNNSVTKSHNTHIS